MTGHDISVSTGSLQLSSRLCEIVRIKEDITYCIPIDYCLYTRSPLLIGKKRASNIERICSFYRRSSTQRVTTDKQHPKTRKALGSRAFVLIPELKSAYPTYFRARISNFTGRIIFLGSKMAFKSSWVRMPSSNTRSYTLRPVSKAFLAIFVE